ncbi:transposase [Streptomyces sp. NPDC052107]|uniref:transposase n=1 Tax=Streptomyces sp. NPDC052107 TaxID=3155632 RepID=UPI003441B2D1
MAETLQKCGPGHIGTAPRLRRRVADSYTTLRASIKTGNLGPEGAKRRRKAQSKPIAFHPDAAHTYDDRCLSWNHDSQTVSVWTVAGRIKNVRFACSAAALKQLAEHARLGRYRRWQARKKAELQARHTRSARQLLKKRARREARHATHVNHKISRTVVAVAQRTERGIALEELTGIRERVTVPRDQRARQSSWPFHQLGSFIAYKAKRAGVPFIEVDPAYTSQRCPRCGHTGRANRPTRDHFSFMAEWLTVVGGG